MKAKSRTTLALEVLTLESENVRLREALAPFARAAEKVCPNVTDSVGLHACTGALRSLEVGYLRRAKSVLNNSPRKA